MAHTPPVPAANQSPYPIHEPPHAETESSGSENSGSVLDQASTSLNQGVTAARDAAGPIVDKARSFARERPWATAALAGTIGLALFNTLRGKRANA